MSQLETLKEIVKLMKNNQIDVIKFGDIEVCITRHTVSDGDKVSETTEIVSEEDLLFHSSDDMYSDEE